MEDDLNEAQGLTRPTRSDVDMDVDESGEGIVKGEAQQTSGMTHC